MSLLEMHGISKAFNGVPVLTDVSLTVGQGEVHALLGENGAGKSTLMNILTGVHPRDAGAISFDGHDMGVVTIRRSEELGIAFVHQELNLFSDLMVYENIFIGKEYTSRTGRLLKKEMIGEAARLFSELGVSIDPTALVSDLTASQKQLLEISKALFFNAKLLILDEPTTSLNNDEVDHLFGIISRLKEGGTSFIFISHKMPEVFRIADRYTVLRNGRFIETGSIADTTPELVASKMVGDGYSSASVYAPRQTGETVLELQHLSGPGFSDVSLRAGKGQVIGLTGLQGSGSSELLQCVFGHTRPSAGHILVHGTEARLSTIHEAMKAGIAMLPTDRKNNSVLPDMTVLENMYIAEHTLSAAKPVISRRLERARYEKYREMLSIKAAGPEAPVVSMSGGNQQKVFLARWLNTEADILLLDNPTQGIDVGAKAEIYRLILELAKSGKTILINTLEIPELEKVADLCAVFYNGSIIRILTHDEINETAVMLYSTGAAGTEEAEGARAGKEVHA